MKRQFARVKGVLHSFVKESPDVSLCGAERSKRTKLYNEAPKKTKKCNDCEELWKEVERKKAVEIELRPGDRVVLKSGFTYEVEEVDETSIYCRRVRQA